MHCHFKIRLQRNNYGFSLGHFLSLSLSLSVSLCLSLKMYIYFALRGTSCPEEVHNSKGWYIQPTSHMSELGNGSLRPANSHGSEFQRRFTLCSTLRWLTLANTFISARVLNSAVSRFPVHKNEEIRNFCCFKSLSFKVIYHKVIHNSYAYQIVPFKHMCSY